MAKRKILNAAFTGHGAQKNRYHLRPTQEHFNRVTTDQRINTDDLIDAMMDTHLTGIRSVVFNEEPTADPDLEPIFPHVYQPIPGRALWSMHDLLKLQPSISLAPLHLLCLRPSDTQPHLEGITPLHALLFSGYRQSQAVHLAPFHLRTHHMSDFLRLQDFGRHNDRLNQVIEVQYPEIPKNSRRLPTQHYAIQLDPGAHYPLPKVAYEQPPVRAELLYRLMKGWVEVLPMLNRLAPPRKNKYVKATLELARQERLPKEVSDLYLGLHPYKDAIPFDRLYRDDISEEEHAILACTRTLMQAQTPSDMSYYYGACTLAISLISGVSPAVFARSALYRLKRTGFSSLNEGQILKMAWLITEYLDPPRTSVQKLARLDLIQELEEIARDYAQAVDRLPGPLQEELYTMQYRRKSMPAWGVIEGVEDDDD